MNDGGILESIKGNDKPDTDVIEDLVEEEVEVIYDET